MHAAGLAAVKKEQGVYKSNLAKETKDASNAAADKKGTHIADVAKNN
jgi:hypothetical protein